MRRTIDHGEFGQGHAGLSVERTIGAGLATLSPIAARLPRFSGGDRLWYSTSLAKGSLKRWELHFDG